MKFIKPLTNFSHGGVRYYEGERRCVTPEDAGYFCGVGWAKDDSEGDQIPTGEADLSEKILDVQSARHRSAATFGGN
jgi:hypothetical protein